MASKYASKDEEQREYRKRRREFDAANGDLKNHPVHEYVEYYRKIWGCGHKMCKTSENTLKVISMYLSGHKLEDILKYAINDKEWGDIDLEEIQDAIEGATKCTQKSVREATQYIKNNYCGKVIESDKLYNELQSKGYCRLTIRIALVKSNVDYLTKYRPRELFIKVPHPKAHNFNIEVSDAILMELACISSDEHISINELIEQFISDGILSYKEVMAQ